MSGSRKKGKQVPTHTENDPETPNDEEAAEGVVLGDKSFGISPIE